MRTASRSSTTWPMPSVKRAGRGSRPKKSSTRARWRKSSPSSRRSDSVSQMSTPAPTPPAEARRLAAADDWELLDTPSEDLFDAFTRLAAQLSAAPIALISLVDRDRLWFTSVLGLEVRERSE